jgi:hypothetical protein
MNDMNTSAEVREIERFDWDDGGMMLMTDSDYGRANKVLALLQSKEDEIARLREVVDAVKYARDWYERLGQVCEFEGMPMIYASVLLELGEKADALSPTKPNEGA